ncbi:hypothetical protein NC796_15755 [Aliifodinibius sp. S!AR15-10]|uniref:GNVR domain-containing protein n=1 Tax=Aliifodinibius sp. S!AR15-10 TaxID=2950437 RepID=UPI0028652956|nr:GNVR domain-containing protein [Aliifodinibius sp. S!AR15-10]MDR8392611.1 hypothetical protein [Aliifodinibius sp. S!AR15-10]
MYRLVPVEESKRYDFSTISLFDLFRYYLEERRIFYWCIGLFLAIGLFFAFTSPVEYETRATIIPEYDMQDKVNQLVERYGLIFGLTEGLSGNEAPPTFLLRLYPYMVESVRFKQQLIRRPFDYSEVDSSITLYDYFTDFDRPSVFETIHRYTLGLPELLSQSDESRSRFESVPIYTTRDSLNDTTVVTRFPILDIPAHEQSVINKVNNRVNASYERQTGIITIRAKMPTPELAATAVQLTLQELYEQASAYKTEKGRLYMDFLNRQLDLAGQSLKDAREALMEFNQTENQPLNERMRLQSNYEESLDRYNTVLRQRNRLESNIQEQLPPFRILDDITIPGTKSEPNRKLIIILSLLTGFFMALGWTTVVFLKSKLSQNST